MSPPVTSTPAEDPWLQVTSSRQLPGWLAEQKISLAFTTYQTGKLLLVGVGAEGKLAVFERSFSRCMGLWADPDSQSLWMSSIHQLWRFQNMLAPGQLHNGHDRLYVPKIAYTTGDLDIHDIAIESTGRVIFVNTLFSCLATLSERHSFTPLWNPPFISKLAAEDRCHLNGLALRDGKAAYVTSCGAGNLVDGWRDRRRDGGCVIDVRSNQIIATGLSMPHSPRLHEGKLYVHNSGAGEFGTIDVASGKFIPIAFCPGYLRGLAFTGNYAIVGLSRPRKDKTFAGLELDGRLASQHAESRCGLHVIDLRTGDTVHWLRLEGMVTELYDVAILPGVKRPMALGFKTDEIQRMIAVGDSEPL